MTDYDTILFAFLWSDLAQTVAKAHARIQTRELQISDVGRAITLLCIHLKAEYPLHSELSAAFSWLDGDAVYLMEQLYGKNFLAGTIEPKFYC